MEERIKQISRCLKAVFTCYWLLAILMVVCGETLDSWTGLYAGDVRSTYQAETATILLAVVCVPVSLKLFSWVLDHKIDAVSLPEALRLYAWWSVVRLFLLFLPVVVGFLTYYLMLSTKGVLCALIALTASLFCIPGENRLRKELRIDKEKRSMSTSYFINDRIYLRAIEPEDLDIMYTMENDPQTWDITNFTVPYSRYALRQYIENSQCDMFADCQLRLMIVRRDDRTVIGTIDITEFMPIHARGEVGIVIRKEYQGQGYATDALHLLCNYAFGFLHMKQLTAHVTVDNEASMRLFTSCGFVKCGLLKEWWCVGGTFKDVVLLQLLRDQATGNRKV